MDLQAILNQHVIYSLVQEDITCRLTGETLNRDTCAVVLDENDEPIMVFDPSVPALLELEDGSSPLNEGYTWMDR